MFQRHKNDKLYGFISVDDFNDSLDEVTTLESEDSKDLHESPDNKILVQIKIPSFSEKQQAANKGILSNTFPFKDEIGLYDKIITEHGRHFVVGKYSQKSPQQILFGENNVQNVEPS